MYRLRAVEGSIITIGNLQLFKSDDVGYWPMAIGYTPTGLEKLKIYSLCVDLIKFLGLSFCLKAYT